MSRPPIKKGLREVGANLGKLRSRLVIFDGDDTLWPNQMYYDAAIRTFADLMKKNALSGRKAVRMLDEIDRANVVKLGYSRRRFPISLEATYRGLCQEMKLIPRRAILARVRRIGRGVFMHRPKLNPGASTALARLVTHNRLVLFTAGDELVQRRKIKLLRLARYFDRVVIVPSKTTAEFKKLLKKERLKARDAIMVGNSLRSDILPAQQAGIPTILFLARTWHYESRVLVKQSLRKVRNLSRLPRIISQMAQER